MKSIYFISAMMLLFCAKGLAQSNQAPTDILQYCLGWLVHPAGANF
jgi:hypothetical protein